MDMDILPTRARELREEKGLTQQEVADRLKCPLSLYQKCENGEQQLELECAVALVDLYDVSMDYLYLFSDSRESIYKRK